MAPVHELPNDPDDNPCFACGPRNPVGLHMRFHDDGHVLTSELTLDDRYCGWPGHVLEGILYSAMDDMPFWASWARWGALANAEPKVRVEFPGRVRTNEPFTLRCWAEPQATDGWTPFRVDVEQRGKVRATYTRRLRPLTREEAQQAARLPALPRTIRADLATQLER